MRFFYVNNHDFLFYDSLCNKLEWLPNIDPLENQKRLANHGFCVCPEGNGVDTHRLWECLYLKVVPIVVKSEFTTILQKQEIPLVVLEKWEDLNITILNYSDFHFDTEKLIKTLNFTDDYLI